jgi:hypothetical protein
MTVRNETGKTPGEPACQHAKPSRMLARRSGVSAVAVEAFMNNAG